MKFQHVVALLVLGAPLYAGEVSLKETKQVVTETPFDKGLNSVGGMLGLSFYF